MGSVINPGGGSRSLRFPLLGGKEGDRNQGAGEPGQGREGAALPGGRGPGRAPGAPGSTRRQGQGKGQGARDRGGQDRTLSPHILNLYRLPPSQTTL